MTALETGLLSLYRAVYCWMGDRKGSRTVNILLQQMPHGEPPDNFC